MTVLNFPASPTVNDTYTENNVTYTWNGSYWDANNTGSLDDIYVEVSGDVMTGNLLLPGGGGNTAALQKQEITDLPVSTFDNDSGYITSSDIPPGTVSYWNKDGSDLKPVTDTDNVNIGDGKITLNAADGSIVAAGQIRSNNGTSSTPAIIGWGDQNIDAKLFQGVNAGGVPVFEVLSNGSAEFADDVLIGGTLPSAPNISLSADATIKTGQNPGSSANDATGAAIYGTQGLVTAYKNTAETRPFFTGTQYNNDSKKRFKFIVHHDGQVVISPESNNIGAKASTKLNADGSAEFSGRILVWDGVDTNKYSYLSPGGVIQSAFTTKSAGQPVWQGYGGGEETSYIMADGTIGLGGDIQNGSPSITLNANGSGEFASVVRVAQDSGGGYINPNTSTNQFEIVSTPNGAINVEVRLASGGNGAYIPFNGTSWSPFTSESRLKDIIGDVDKEQSWDLIRDIELKRYFYKDQDTKFRTDTRVSYAGPMADWLGKQDPELLIDTGRSDDEGSIHTFNQGLLDMKALQALSTALTRIEELEARLDAAGV
jgi:hypothetical protein